MAHGVLLARAKQELKMADHITYVTYPIIKDKRLFRSILEHLTNNSHLIIKAYLEYECYLKNLTSVPGDDRFALGLFLEKYSSLFGLSAEEKRLLSELFTMKNVIKSAKSSDFERGDKFFMISPTYKILGIEIRSIKNYLNTLKKLNDSIEKKISGASV